jgi:hypothetical protein
MPNIASLVQETEALCRAVSKRDLEGLPLYVVPQSSIAHAWGNAESWGGYTGYCLDVFLADYIPGYRGRGPCLVVNDLALSKETPDMRRKKFIATAIHELAHVLDSPSLSLYAVSTLKPSDARQEAAECRAEVNAEPPIRESLYEYHGATFLRILIHLCRRAGVAGTPIAPQDAHDTFHTGLSPISHYDEALADEPERRATDLFCSIMASDPPSAFTELWERDRERSGRILAAATNRHSLSAAFWSGVKAINRAEDDAEMAA